MKKLFFVAIIVIFGSLSVNAQGQFNGGVNAGLITGDFSDFYSFNLTIDASYLWEVSDQIEVGAATGFSHSFGKDTDFADAEDAQFLPLAAAGRFNISDEFTVGVDLGYAVGINDGNDGGFYYAPRVQYAVSESLDVVVAYRGISLDAGPISVGFNVITAGVEFAL
ncbi:outer membrane beta-barrel protein [Hyunsoonleella ulvae]|uniref:outer membrane beta-barrel protein n=1 Tax=Hyunsoonleella ulvae TaxID=2799948 RepID=UPI00193A8D50|nr:outer membrane beta-barrel protein [Hyunsoonleella ulvae]